MAGLKNNSKPKTPNSSTGAAKGPKKCTPAKEEPLLQISDTRTWVDLLEPVSFTMFPEKDAWRKRLAMTMLIWAEAPDSYEILQFCMKYKIKRTTLYLWREKYPDIREVMDEVKLFLACRRRIGVITKDLDREAVFKDLHNYDPEWLAVNKYWADMKNAEEKADSQITVVLQQVESTGKVRPLVVNQESNDAE